MKNIFSDPQMTLFPSIIRCMYNHYEQKINCFWLLKNRLVMLSVTKKSCFGVSMYLQKGEKGIIIYNFQVFYAYYKVCTMQYNTFSTANLYKYILRMNVRALLCNLSLHLLTLEFIFQLVCSLE